MQIYITVFNTMETKPQIFKCQYCTLTAKYLDSFLVLLKSLPTIPQCPIGFILFLNIVLGCLILEKDLMYCILKKMLKNWSGAERSQRKNLRGVERCSSLGYSHSFVCQKEDLHGV